MSNIDIEKTVEGIVNLENSLVELEQTLAEDPKFKAFLTKQKEASKEIAESWKAIEQAMIDNDVKSVKGDWGSITIAERLNWATTEELPAKFYKKTVDTKKISDTFKLTGKAPKGAVPSYTKYLTKRIK